MIEEVSADEAEVVEKILCFLEQVRGNDEKIKEFIVLKLKVDGYNASLCKTSWNANLDHPSGLFFLFLSVL